MVQVRKLVLAIAAASALSSGMANALGLGDLTLKSTLNQPLNAEIELLDARDLNASQVISSLATSADFAHAGVDRQAFLDDLTFTPVLNASGKSVLRITSSKPVRDPYMKFLVQVLWPNGRLLREYSVLLDPPKAAPAAAPTAAAPASAPVAAQPQPITPAQTQAPVIAQTPPAPAAATLPAPTPAVEAQPAQYTTARHDRLWDIASRVRNGNSVQQNMLAIQALNPGAFINGNINRMKVGEVLRLPDQQQAAATAQPQAVAQVAEQNRAWRQGRSLPSKARQVDATRHAKADAAPASVDIKDNLSLVSGDAKSGKKGATGDAKALNNQLAVAKENLDTQRRDNAELKSRMTDLQSQLDKLQRLIQLKNDQLAKMQAQSGAAPAATDTAPGTSPALPAALVAAAPAPGAEVPVKPAGEIAPEDAMPPPGAQVTAAPDVAPIAPVPGGVVESADTDSAISKLLANPTLLGIVGGGALVVILLLLLLLARRRNAQQEAEKHKRMARALAEESEFASDMDLPENSFDGLDVAPPSVKLAPVPVTVPAPVIVEPVHERSTDVLDQANVHVANGRLNQAAELLEEAIKYEPQRSELRLKLMEIYAEQGDNSGFTAQERKLVANGKNHAEVEQLKSRFPLMVMAGAGLGAAALAAEMHADYVKDLMHDESEPAIPAPVVAPVIAATPAVAPPADELDSFDHDFDLSLDDLEEASPTIVEDKSAPALEKPALDDDELSFESVLRQQNEAKQATPDVTSEELDDFDLGLSDEPSSLTAEDDFLASLEDDLRDLPPFDDAPALEPAETVKAPEDELDEPDLPDDFDLSLSDDIEADPTPNAFTTELDDVNAELDRLSERMDQPTESKAPEPKAATAKPFPTPPVFSADDALDADDEPEFDFLAGTDEAATKLDLARAYIEMGDSDGARDILDEVVGEGDEAQKTEAREMIASLH